MMEACKLLLTLLPVLTLTRAAEPWSQKPKFCRTNDCPVYQVLKQYANFEQRVYEESRWVSTPLEEDYLGMEMVKSFRRLFNYITGSNDQGLKINMTVPVLIYVPVKQPPAGHSTMSFYISPEVPSAPQPTDPNVYLETLPRVSVYVKSFGGYAIGYQFAKQAKKLAEELRSLGLEFEDSFYYRSGYNDPFTVLNRHNEVWLRAK